MTKPSALRSEPQNLHLRPTLHRGFSPLHDLCRYCVREAIPAAVLAHLSRHLLQDHRGVATLKRYRHLSGVSLNVFANHASLSDEGLRATEIAEKIGLPMPVVRSIITRRDHADSWRGLAEDEVAAAEVADAVETTFGLERDLQLALRANLEQLERGLKVTDGGKEQSVESGRIDITAEDSKGKTVVIELKAGEVDREAIGQVLSYVGDLSKTKESVRASLVAGSFTTHAVSAARAVPNLQLKKYAFKFTFGAVAV